MAIGKNFEHWTLVFSEKIVPVQPQVGDICDVCKMIVAYADKELAKNATTAEIEDFLERVCRYLPASVSDQVK